MKKIAFIILIAATFAIGGCSQAETSDNNGSSGQTPPETVVKEVTEEVTVEEPTVDTTEDTSEVSPPEDVLGLQYQYINSGRYEEAYNLFAQESQLLISQDQYEDFFSSTYEVSEYSVTSMQTQGATATIQADLVVTDSQQGTQRYSVTQEMVLEDESWRAIMRDEQVDTFAQAPQGSTEPEPGTYGSDPYLDGLYDDCADGEATACEELLIESPVASEYEDFASENYREEEPFTYGDDAYLDGLADDCGAGDTAACDELYMYSPEDSAYEAFAIEEGGKMPDWVPPYRSYEPGYAPL